MEVDKADQEWSVGSLFLLMIRYKLSELESRFLLIFAIFF
jgi:hypothetical protein